MNKIIILFIIGVLSFPSFVAGKLIDTDKFSIEGRILAGAGSINSEGNDAEGYNGELHLDIKAKIVENLHLNGSLDGYAYWGDYSDTYSNVVRAESAYFDWSNIAKSNISLSIGRRPSFYDLTPDSNNITMSPGTPFDYSADFNINGATISYSLSSLTDVPGMNFRLGYGRGITSEWGNDDRLRDDISKYLSDSDLGGIILDLYKDGKTFVQTSFFIAEDVNDGISASIAFPVQFANLFAPTLYADIQNFPTIPFTRYDTPSTVIGNINQIGLNAAHTLGNDFTLFASLAMTQLRPNGQAGMFGGLGSDAVYEARLREDGSEVFMVPVRSVEDDSMEGYGLYVGVQLPVPMGKVGLEYNYGSKYWTPFIQNQDELLGNKLTTRGHAAEAYYILELNSYTQIKVGGIYYDYEYTGSGSPVGQPQNIKDIESGDAFSLYPVIDTLWRTYIKLALEF